MTNAKRPRNLWVHRLASSEGGRPTASVKLGTSDNLLRVRDEIVAATPLVLEDDAEGARAFLAKELAEGRLRQGWSYPGCDLRKADFRDRYVVAMRKYSNAIPESALDRLRNGEHDAVREVLLPFYKEAQGRFHVLERMMRMSLGDVVFVPNVPDGGKSFSVARIAGPYEFEDRTKVVATKSWQLDFGHRRAVKDVKVFEYSDSTLTPEMFGAPYLHAIDPVSARRDELEAFLARHHP